MSSVSGLCGGCSVSLLEDEARGQPCVCGGGGGGGGRKEERNHVCFLSFLPSHQLSMLYLMLTSSCFLRFTPAVLLMFLIATEEDYRRVVKTFGYYIIVLNG